MKIKTPYLFHATTLNNVKSILSKGPQIGTHWTLWEPGAKHFSNILQQNTGMETVVIQCPYHFFSSLVLSPDFSQLEDPDMELIRYAHNLPGNTQKDWVHERWKRSEQRPRDCLSITGSVRSLQKVLITSEMIKNPDDFA